MSKYGDNFKAVNCFGVTFRDGTTDGVRVANTSGYAVHVFLGNNNSAPERFHCTSIVFPAHGETLVGYDLWHYVESIFSSDSPGAFSNLVPNFNECGRAVI